MQMVAFILIGGGVLTAVGFFLKWFFTTSLISLGFRIAVAVVLVGIVLLLISAGWGRYRATKTEKFKEVKH